MGRNPSELQLPSLLHEQMFGGHIRGEARQELRPPETRDEKQTPCTTHAGFLSSLTKSFYLSASEHRKHLTRQFRNSLSTAFTFRSRHSPGERGTESLEVRTYLLSCRRRNCLTVQQVEEPSQCRGRDGTGGPQRKKRK